MFSSNQGGQNVVAVALKLVSGETEKGHLNAGITGNLADALNKPTPFVELIGSDGKITMISKTAVERIDLIEVPKTNQLSKRLADEGLPNPYKVLGVAEAASAKKIKAAYHDLARRYHPDNYSGEDIPKEITDYASAMFMRITSAYNDLKADSEQQDAA